MTRTKVWYAELRIWDWLSANDGIPLSRPVYVGCYHGDCYSQEYGTSCIYLLSLCLHEHTVRPFLCANEIQLDCVGLITRACLASGYWNVF